MSDLSAFVREFVLETSENLDQLDRDLVELEKNPMAREQLARVFRAIHSIKGATGFLGFSKLGTLAHAGEGLLSRLRDGVLVLNANITSGLLELVDCIRRMVSNIEKAGDEGDLDCTALVEKLALLQSPAGAQRPTPAEPPSLSENLAPVALGAGSTNSQTQAPPEHNPSPDPIQASRANSTSSSLRVDVRQLDKLMNLVGELVLTRNELLQFSYVEQNAVPQGTSQRLNSITTELQDEIMKVRMQPIDNVWSRFPRLVRDLALRGGKKVRLELRGKETELDKTLIEAITDPLTHLVRNAVDHGLETPEIRAAAGKLAEGRLLLHAFHEGGQVHIEVSDDGAGIDLGRLKRTAVKRTLITAEQARAMNDQEAINLVFLPGFSTSESVTDVSGRGVGMDVVKTNIEKVGGEVSIDSQPGSGTTVRIKIPLTLAIMPALVVTADANRFAIPQASILHLARVAGDDLRKKIEMIHNASAFRLRGELLPIIWLSEELKGGSQNEAGQSREGKDFVDIVFLEAGDRRFGLVVDEVNDTQEIVVKPLGKQLRGTSIFAGSTIMGDGKVVLIIDVFGMALHAHVITELHDGKTLKAKSLPKEAAPETQVLLLFTGASDSRMAVPLSQVTRLEEFPYASVEHSGSLDLVQYRGGVLPLLKIEALLPERRSRPRRPQGSGKDTKDDKVQAIVYSKDGHQVGLVVEEIVDTVEHSMAHLRPASRKGVSASAVIQARITEILDLHTMCSDLQSRILEGERV